MCKFLVFLVFIISLKGLFLPLDLSIFRNPIVYSVFLIFTSLLLILQKPKLKIDKVYTIVIFYLLLHSLIFPNLFLTNFKYIIYVFILIFLINYTRYLKYSIDILTVLFTLYCFSSLILHLFFTIFDLHESWSIQHNPIFESNNDLVKRATTHGEIFYSPFSLFLVGNWTYEIMNITIYRFMGFSTEPTFMCIIILPLLFYSLHHYKNTSSVYLISVFVFTISLLFTFSLSCLISIILGFLLYYFIRNIDLFSSFKYTSISIIIIYLVYNYIIKIIFTNKINETNFYLSKFVFSNISMFGFLLGSKSEDSNFITFGVINVFTTYGFIGILLWFLIISKFLFSSYKLSKNPEYKYLSILLISISFLSFKNVHFLNFYFLLFMIYCYKFTKDTCHRKKLRIKLNFC